MTPRAKAKAEAARKPEPEFERTGNILFSTCQTCGALVSDHPKPQELHRRWHVTREAK